MGLPPRNSGRTLAVALLVLLASGWLATSARAGCVHDALRRALEPTGSAHFRWLILAGALDAPAAEDGPVTWPADREMRGDRRPCDGPTCSRRDGPPPAPVVTVAPAVEPWAWAGLERSSAGPRAEPLFPSRARVRPVSHGGSIFHPPRPAAAS